MSSAPDAELVALCRRESDAEAFRQLVERHKQLVFAVALAHAGDPALAEDVAQEAFVAAWRDMSGLREPDRVGSWVAGIARNLARSALRNRARRASHRLDEPPPAATPEDEVLAREDRELVGRALAEVPAVHREALVLHYLEGQPVARIAEVLGVREDLVKQRLSRGRRALRASVAARVEAALVRVRPGAFFTPSVVAATRTPASAGAAGKGLTIMSMSIKKAAIAAAALATVAVAGSVLYLNRADGGEHDRAAPATGVQPDPAARGAAERPAATGAAAARTSIVRRIDPATRASRLEAIRKARSASAAGGDRRVAAKEPPPSLAAADGDLDKAYIREAVQGLLPLLTECYQEGLERNPALAGMVAVDFTIEGEPEVGGVVGESSIRKTSLDDPAVLECIQETMYALEIDPPTGGGIVHVTYPFKFSPDGDREE